MCSPPGRATPPYAAWLRLQLTEVADSPSVAARLLELAARPLATHEHQRPGRSHRPLSRCITRNHRRNSKSKLMDARCASCRVESESRGSSSHKISGVFAFG